MRRILKSLLALALVAAAPSAAFAMLVPINHAQRLDVPGSAASVIVGNADIISVTVVDSHTVYIMGRTAGTTNVVVLDKAGRALFSGEITVAASGANVTVYRGATRSTVNCSFGCVEAADGDKTPLASIGGSNPGVISGGAVKSATGGMP